MEKISLKNINKILGEILVGLVLVLIIYSIYKVIFGELFFKFQDKLVKVILIIAAAKFSLFIITVNTRKVLKELKSVNLKDMLDIRFLYFAIILLLLLSVILSIWKRLDQISLLIKFVYYLLILGAAISIIGVIKNIFSHK